MEAYPQNLRESRNSFLLRTISGSNPVHSLEIAEDLCRKRKPNEAAPYIEKAMEDPRNLDAWISAAFVAPNLDISTGWLEEAEKQGRV